PSSVPALVINSRTDVALAAGADGVHLRSDDITPGDVRKIWAHYGTGTPFDTLRPSAVQPTPFIAVSCHSSAYVIRAEAWRARLAVLAPVFEKHDAQPTGLEALREASKSKIPVLALGGVTLANARSCLDAGAAGIAAIRLFQENRIADVVRQLRNL
ncbi:MAG TPA: thiamine phosphate synthase, partial [Candidatus Binatia bacterium]|nr:thiamine phosphate synthase [Candidatus Binatia bacterium]